MGVMRRSLQGVLSKSYGEGWLLVVSHFLKHKRVKGFLKTQIVGMVFLTIVVFQEHRFQVKLNSNVDINL